MNFRKLHEDTLCECTSNGSREDVATIYVRRLMGSPVSEKDFASHWELGKRAKDANCTAVCRYKGLSVYDCEAYDSLLLKWRTTATINPSFSTHALKLRFKHGAGVIKNAPSKDSDAHCTFYKDDDFTIGHIEIIGIESLS